jgi:plastocyanin
MAFLKTAFMLAMCLGSLSLPAFGEDLHVRVQIKHESGSAEKAPSNANAVIWLTPLDTPLAVSAMQHVQLVQKDKRFVPHLLVITAGTKVAFPNEDPFFHNVFSIYNGKRFDLGLYETGSSRSVEFNRPGVSFIFCNIHPSMSGIVVVLDTPYFGQSNAAGGITIKNVPEGRYRLNVWYEQSSEQALQKLSRVVNLPLQHDLGVIEVPEVVPADLPHKNKYGKDYDTNEPYKP